ncbi:hypothetical protein BH10BAC5_BH10BAC5_03460 [soil metagenome]
MTIKSSKFLILILFVSSAIIFQSCDSTDGGVTGPVNFNMDFAYKAKDSTINYTGADVIIFDTVKMLIKDVTIQGQFGGVNDVLPGTTEVYLNTNGSGFSSYMSALIPNSQYVSINYFLKSKTVDDGIIDPDFTTGVSFVVKGKFNGVPFVYTSGAIDQNYGLVFPSNFRVADGTSHLTITYNPKLWFSANTDTGIIIVSPLTLTPALRTYIDDSFRGSLAATLSFAFRDDNKDGLPD